MPHITKKDRPLTAEHFSEFEKCYGADPNGRSKRKVTDSKEDRWHSFQIEEVKQRDYKIDGLKWLKDESLEDDELVEPEELATDAIAELAFATQDLNRVLTLLENGSTIRLYSASGIFNRMTFSIAVPCTSVRLTPRFRGVF